MSLIIFRDNMFKNLTLQGRFKFVAYLFNYQNKVWGTYVPSVSAFSLAGLRLYYFLKNIRGKSGKILEIGSGAGGNLQAIRRYKPYAKLYGVDIGSAAIEYGRKHFSTLELSVAPAEKLPFENNYFDVVCFFDVLEHVVNPSECIVEAKRVMKNDGIFHAYVPCEGELWSLHGILNYFGVNLKEKTAGHIQKLKRKDLILFCENAGLAIVDLKWSCHLLNQIGDLSYYACLHLTGKRLASSLEGSVGENNNLLVKKGISILKGLVSMVWNYESRLLWFLPGSGVHITCVVDLDMRMDVR